MVNLPFAVVSFSSAAQGQESGCSNALVILTEQCEKLEVKRVTQNIKAIQMQLALIALQNRSIIVLYYASPDLYEAVQP